MSLIGESLEPASISALAAIFGSLSGALASGAGTWITQRHQDRREILAKRLFHREQLYSDFINESAHALADAIQRKAYVPNNLSPTYALLSRMRLSSSTDVLASAEQIISTFLLRIRSPTSLRKNFSLGLLSARIHWASSVVSVAQNSRECNSYCNNDLNDGGI